MHHGSHVSSFFFLHCRRFNLIESKETDVLRDLEIALRLTDDPSSPQQPASLTSSETNSQTTLLQQSSLSSLASTMPATTATTSMVNVDDTTVCLIDGDATIQPICTQPESGVPRSTASPSSMAQQHAISAMSSSNSPAATPTHSAT